MLLSSLGSKNKSDFMVPKPPPVKIPEQTDSDDDIGKEKIIKRLVFSKDEEGHEEETANDPNSSVDSLLNRLGLAAGPRPKSPKDSSEYYVSPTARDILQHIFSLQFDTLALARNTNNHALYHVGLTLMRSLGLVQKFRIDVEVLKQFLKKVEATYNGVPYHNSTHAAEVLQTFVHLMRRTPGVILNDLDFLACVIAGACHDIGHPGCNNLYLVQTRHPLSLLYNDQSVLENFHCLCTFRLLCETGLLSSLSDSEMAYIRSLIIELILATDMNSHFKIMSRFSTRLEAASSLNLRDNLEDKRLVLSVLLKLSDMSHVLKNPDMCLPFSKVIVVVIVIIIVL